MSYFLKSNYRLEVDNEKADQESYAFSLPDSGDRLLTDKLDAVIDRISQKDPDRAHELKAIRSSASRKFDGYKIACLVRVNVCDLSRPPSQRKVTDLDGIVMKISKNEFSVELFEAKNRRNAHSLAKKDIKKSLVPMLEKTAKGYRIKEIRNVGAKLIIAFRN